MDVERFFTQVLPQRVAERADLFLLLTGHVSFGVGDADTWTIAFGELENPVARGGRDDAELKLWFSPRAFDALLEGTLDVGGAVARQEVLVSGQIDLLWHLGRLLSAVARPPGRVS